jgi:hypothetical protein
MSNLVQFSNGLIIHESLVRKIEPTYSMTKKRRLVVQPGVPVASIHTDLILTSRWTLSYIEDDDSVQEVVLGENKGVWVGDLDEDLDEYIQDLVDDEVQKKVVEKKRKWFDDHVEWAKKRMQRISDIYTEMNDAGVPTASTVDDAPGSAPGDDAPVSGSPSLEHKLESNIEYLNAMLGDVGTGEKPGYGILGDHPSDWDESIDKFIVWLASVGVSVDDDKIEQLLVSPIRG